MGTRRQVAFLAVGLLVAAAFSWRFSVLQQARRDQASSTAQPQRAPHAARAAQDPDGERAASGSAAGGARHGRPAAASRGVALRARIAAARRGRKATQGGEPAPIDRAYVQRAARSIAPLMQECYELALAQDDSLAGRVVLEFAIEAEPDAGSVVEQPRIHEDSTMRHPVFDECMTETLFSLELPPLARSGSVRVKYPFTFARHRTD